MTHAQTLAALRPASIASSAPSALVAALAAALVSFGSAAGAPGGPAPAAAPKPPAGAAGEDPAPDVSGPAVQATNAFGVKLFSLLAGAAPAGNVFISPYSISVALTMAAEGARDATAMEMASVLAFPAAAGEAERPIDAVHRGHKWLAERFRQAEGAADDATRSHIEELRRRLDDANARARDLQRQNKWDEAGRAAQEAQKTAQELNTLLPAVDRFQLRSANALWLEKTFRIQPSFTETVGRYYGGGVTPVDFKGAPEAARTLINRWVAEQTENRIRDLIPSGGITPMMRLVITNAVYFRGEWAAPFQPANTNEQPFTLPDGTTVQVPLMQDHWRGGVSYAAFSADGTYFKTPMQVPRDESKRPPTYPDAGGFQMIELPYKGGELAMVVLLPQSQEGLQRLESRLSADRLGEWLSRMLPRGVDTSIPRFSMEYSCELTEELKRLGMRRALTQPPGPEAAEFQGISAGSDPSQQLFIGAILHKAWVDVSEKGTEAAAATAILMPPGAAMAPPEVMVPFTPVVRADHPFLFLIRDTRSGVVLFMGRVADPRG